MRRMLFVLMLMCGLLFAGSSGNVRSALYELEETSRTMMLFSAIIQLFLTALFIGVAALVYLKRLKGVEKRSVLWIAVAVIAVIIGLFFLLGMLMSLLMYFAAPAMTQTLVTG